MIDELNLLKNHLDIVQRKHLFNIQFWSVCFWISCQNVSSLADSESLTHDFTCIVTNITRLQMVNYLYIMTWWKSPFYYHYYFMTNIRILNNLIRCKSWIVENLLNSLLFSSFFAVIYGFCRERNKSTILLFDLSRCITMSETLLGL